MLSHQAGAGRGKHCEPEADEHSSQQDDGQAPAQPGQKQTSRPQQKGQGDGVLLQPLHEQRQQTARQQTGKGVQRGGQAGRPGGPQSRFCHVEGNIGIECMLQDEKEEAYQGHAPYIAGDAPLSRRLFRCIQRPFGQVQQHNEKAGDQQEKRAVRRPPAEPGEPPAQQRERRPAQADDGRLEPHHLAALPALIAVTDQGGGGCDHAADPQAHDGGTDQQWNDAAVDEERTQPARHIAACGEQDDRPLIYSPRQYPGQQRGGQAHQGGQGEYHLDSGDVHIAELLRDFRHHRGDGQIAHHGKAGT